MTDNNEKPSIEEVGKSVRSIGLFIMLGVVLVAMLACLFTFVFAL